MKCVVAINNLTSVEQGSYANHIHLFYRLGVMKGRAIERKDEDIEFMFFNPRRMSIDRVRNEAAVLAMQHEYDYLWFIDDDVLLPDPRVIDTFSVLKNTNKDIIAAVTHIRGYPFNPMIFNFTHEDYKDNSYVVDYKEKANPATGLLECDAVGFSCCLIKVSLLKQLIPPFFITSANQTEDVYFCKRVKEQLPETKIYAHTWIGTAHNLGPDYVDPDNVELWREFMEKRFPNLKKDREKELQRRKQGRGDHDVEHLKQIIETI